MQDPALLDKNNPTTTHRKKPVDLDDDFQEVFGKELPITKLPNELSTLLSPGKVFVFTKTNCPFCSLAKDYLEQKEVPYEYVLCDKLGITDEQKEQLFKLTGAKSYPRIFVGTKSVGGFDDLKEKDNQGILEKWLKEEGIHFAIDWYTSSN